MSTVKIKLIKKRNVQNGSPRRGANRISHEFASQANPSATPIAVRGSARTDSASASSGLPLNREAVKLAVDSIPQDRDAELLRNIVEAGQNGDMQTIRRLLVRWVMIGSHYGDPDREKNHPLAKVVGSLKGEEWLEEGMARIYRQREIDRQ